MSDVHILACTAGGATVLVSVEGDELAVGGFDPELKQRSASTTPTATC